MYKSEFVKIIACGAGAVVDASKFSMDDLAELLHSTDTLVVIEIPDSMTTEEIKRIAKEGRGHVFLIGNRMKITDR